MGDSAIGHHSYQAPVLPSTLCVLYHMVGLSCVQGEKALGACEFFPENHVVLVGGLDPRK